MTEKELSEDEKTEAFFDAIDEAREEAVERLTPGVLERAFEIAIKEANAAGLWQVSITLE